MQKVCLIAFIFCLYSCNTKNNTGTDKWQILDSARGLSYTITETGRGEKGEVWIQYFGWRKGDKVVKDTSAEPQFLFAQFITPELTDNKEIKRLPKGTSGFISVNTANLFQEAYSEIRHYTLFLSGGITDKTLKDDSVKLELLGVFRKISIVNHEKALAKFTEDDSDTTWKTFIKSNPLPVSVELTLKKEFLTKDKYDSIKNMLSELLPAWEIQTPYQNGLLNSNSAMIEQEIVYKFIIF